MENLIELLLILGMGAAGLGWLVLRNLCAPAPGAVDADARWDRAPHLDTKDTPEFDGLRHDLDVRLSRFLDAPCPTGTLSARR